MSITPGGKRKSIQSTLNFAPAEKKGKPDSDIVADIPETVDSVPMETSPSLQPLVSNTFRKVGGVAAPKRLIVKDFKVKPKLPTDFEESTWKKLQEAIIAVQKKAPVSCSLEELYKAVENMCIHKMAPNLFQRLQQQCEEHIKNEVSRLVGQTTDHEMYLQLVNSCWQDHCSQMHMIRSIFLYLDRTHVIQTPTRSIWDMGLHLFRKHVVTHPEVERKTVSGLLNIIELERKGEMINRSLVHDLLRMYSALQIYAECFQKPFIDATNVYYGQEGLRVLNETEVPDYLKHVESRLNEEADRVVHYLDTHTRKPLILTVEQQLIEKHVDTIIEKGFDGLMQQQRIVDLGRMYRLLQRVSALDKMKVALTAYAKKVGSALVMDPEKDNSLVQELLDFKSKLEQLMEQSFASNETFAYAIRDAFEHFVNLRQNKPAELVAKFVDSKLRAGGTKGTSEEELETLMDRLMVLFRYIHGKDVFEAFYKKDLAKRLLLGKSASFDAEKAMISKLKIECGAAFTSKLEGMFKDIELSKDILNSFKQSKAAEQVSDIDMNVFVLTTGYWPNYQPVEIAMPAALGNYEEVFKQFYLSKYSGRRLVWQNTLGTLVLKAVFPKGKKELQVSLFQTVVLLLFNDTDKLSFTEIKAATRLEEMELKRTLMSLACGKVCPLLKEPANDVIDGNDVFSFNAGFAHKLFRIKINAVQLKETPEENKDTQEEVFQDRQYQIDAAIVRIMKTRKSLNHTLLMAELFKQLKFPFKPADVKKRIESLIEREYIERERDDPQMYLYLA